MTTPVLRITVDKDTRDPAFGVPHEERIGNCTDFAIHYLLKNGGELVHGSIYHAKFSEQRIGHAWVKCEDGGAFDPTLGLWWPHYDLWVGYASAIEDVTYTLEEALVLMAKSDHYGIWHDNPSGVWGE